MPAKVRTFIDFLVDYFERMDYERKDYERKWTSFDDPTVQLAQGNPLSCQVPALPRALRRGSPRHRPDRRHLVRRPPAASGPRWRARASTATCQ
jgi:hypothetical protein